jgi:hypothetical protein
MRSILVSVVAALVPAFGVQAQCTPTLVGFQSGPVDIAPNSPATINALMPFDDGTGPSLVAAGLFGMPPLSGNGTGWMVGRYKNGVWTALQNDLGPSASQRMHDLAQEDFSSVGGPGLSILAGGDGGVYRWSGDHWGVVLGAQATFTLLPYTDAQGPVLLAGGTAPQGVMAWRGNGGSFQYAPLSITGAVSRLRLVDDGSGPAVFAIGTLQDTSRGIASVAKLVNGQWTAYSTGLSSVQYFSDMTTFDDGTHGPELYIAGNFALPGTSNPGVARLRGGIWGAVGAPLSPSSGTDLTFFKVNEGQGEQLYVGGTMDQVTPYSGLVKLTPAGWQAPVLLTRPNGSTQSGSVNAIARFDDGAGMKTYFGGVFSAFHTDPQPGATTSEAFGLIRSTPTGFESAAQGLGELSNSPISTIKYSLSVVDLGQGPRLFAGSPFMRAGGRLARGAAVFDGTNWSPLSLPYNGLSMQAVQFAAVAPLLGQNRLFAYIYGSPLGPVGYWDGSQWVRLSVQPPGSTVYGLNVLNNTLYALTDPGLFHFTGSGWVNDIAGSAPGCMTIGDIGRGRRIYLTLAGPQGPGLYEYDGAIYARLGTSFSTNSSSIAIHDDGAGPTVYISAVGLPGYVGRFQSNTFVQLSPSFSLNGALPVAMASFNDGQGPALYIAGTFTGVGGGVSTNGLVRWHNGVATNPIPFNPSLSIGGLPRPSLAVLGNRLYIAGELYGIGPTPADHLAYIDACPRICAADYNHDGDAGTDADIEDFFACLAGNCCSLCDPADYNGDGDSGTDADIESFFRVLAGGPC